MERIRISPSTGPGSPEVAGFYEPESGSIQYVMTCPATRKCALIDVVMDFEPVAARTGTESAEEILAWVRERGYSIEWILDTHPHADHLMASGWLKDRTGAPNAIGEKVRDIAVLWRGLYNLPEAFDVDRRFDRLFADGESFKVGELDVNVMLSPGHTLGSVTYVAGDAAFVHDTLMYPDSGTSRADFPGGDAATLYRSIQRILALPDSTRTFVGHDYRKDGREPLWEATVAEQKARNIHLKDKPSEADYVAIRNARDATLALPRRMLHALQVNLETRMFV